MQGLVVKKKATDDGVERVRGPHPQTGQPVLLHAVTGQPHPKQSAGVVLLDPDDHTNELQEPPDAFTMPAHYPDEQRDWVERVNARPVHKPGGNLDNPWGTTHTFVHCDQIILHLEAGDAVYDVVHQPDKYTADGDPTDTVGDPTDVVDWHYELEFDAFTPKEA